jgi:hypothetical protein
MQLEQRERPGTRVPDGILRGGHFARAELLLPVAEQVAGLAVEDLAERGQGGEADGAGAAVLEGQRLTTVTPTLSARH